MLLVLQFQIQPKLSPEFTTKSLYLVFSSLNLGMSVSNQWPSGIITVQFILVKKVHNNIVKPSWIANGQETYPIFASPRKSNKLVMISFTGMYEIDTTEGIQLGHCLESAFSSLKSQSVTPTSRTMNYHILGKNFEMTHYNKYVIYIHILVTK